MRTRTIGALEVSAVGLGAMGFSHEYGTTGDGVRRMITRFARDNIRANQPLLEPDHRRRAR